MTAKVDLTLTGSLDHLRIVWQTGEALLESLEFDEDPEGTRYNVLVSLQEMLTNVLRHGYSGDESLPVEVSFECTEKTFSVELRDRGPEFNPLEYGFDGMPTEDGMPEQVGGYGIMIARTVMDGVDYERRDEMNCLTLTKLVQSKSLVSNG